MPTRKRTKLLILCVWVGLASATPLAGVLAQIPDPRLVWRTVRTAHFDVHYHEPLGEVAQHVARICESVNRKLGNDFGYALRERTQVVLTDNTDSANGSARVIPRDVIHLYVTSPGDMSPFSDYDDWLTMLVTHEHTHILHLDQIGGLADIVNAILGKTYAPNDVQATWFIEGLAVYEESVQTTGGRLRSSLFDMYLRMDVLQGRLLRIDQITHGVDRWPHGAVPYLYGSRFVQFIGAKYGDQALARIGREYGRQAIPFGMNRIAKRATGYTFVELYRQFLDEITRKYQEQGRLLKQQGLVEGRPLTHHGEQALGPRYLPDGRLVYYAADGINVPQLRTPEGERILRVSSEANFAPHPNGREAVFDQTAPYREIYWFHDLFNLDLESRETRRLTWGMRASQPDISPDGRRVAYVVEKSGTSHLAVSRLGDIERTKRFLIRSGPYEQVYTPRWSPDGRTIAASFWRRGGKRDIVLIDAETGRVTAVTDDRALDTGPAWSPDGKWLYFSSDRTGVANIYAFELKSGLTYMVTNVVSGAYQPAVSRDGSRLAYVGYSSRGYDIHELRTAEIALRPAPPQLGERATPPIAADGGSLPSRPYNPLPTIWPRNYRIEVEPDDFGYEVGVSVNGSDVVGLHDYDARVRFSLDRLEPSVDLGYSYLPWTISPTVRLYRHIGKRQNLYIGGERTSWVQDVIGGSAGLSYDFHGQLYRESLGFSYSVSYVSADERVKANLDPNTSPPSLPRLGFTPSVRLSWRFSNVDQQTYDISPSSGISLRLSVGATDPLLGADFQAMSLQWVITGFIPMPWLNLHVLALHYAGGQAAGDPGHREVFSVGGFPDQPPLGSVYELIFSGMIPSLGGEALRGYPPHDRAGLQFHLLQAEYRFPVWRMDAGIETLPFYVQRLYATFFADYGDAFSDRLDLATFRLGVGSELLTDFIIGYLINLTLRVGLAQGVSQGGVTQLYLHLGFPF